MGKVIVFAFVVLIVIVGIAAAILLIGGSAKLTSLIWAGKRRKPVEERSAEQIESDQWLADRYRALDKRMLDDR